MAEKPQPVVVQYCQVCSLPPEYCEFGSEFEKCKPWLIQNAPDLYPDLLKANANEADKVADQLQSTGISSADSGGSSEAKPEEVKRLPGGKIKKKEKKEVIIEKVVRNKRKCITTVKGLELFGVKLPKPTEKVASFAMEAATATASSLLLSSAATFGTSRTSDFVLLGVPKPPSFPSPKLKSSVSIRCQSTSTNEPKTKRNILDNASNLLTNFLSGGSLGSMPVAEGAVSDLFGRPLFFSLYDWFLEHGSVYKLAFGPKAFVVVSDPIVARHILRENAFSFDKGVLADILEPIMGKGLIPADLDTWKQRRRVIAPGFHALYLEAMVKVFTDCSERTTAKIEKLLDGEHSRGGDAIELDLEAEYSSLALDIIGLGVFNFDFGSVTKESPVIKVRQYYPLRTPQHGTN